MKGKRSSRSAFLTSLMSLVLCFAMLLGTTLAWFTDTATTGVNRIVAGNLDVEVEYSTDGTTWTNIQGTDSLFSGNLWEPGHTEYVYLRVKNAGTLGLKYKVMVTPVSENGGVNVAGDSFKLSDYLVFGTTTPSTTSTTFADRTAARAAVSTATMGLNQANLTKTGEIKADRPEGAKYDYLALVVYMPDTVGNEANAKPGTTAPSIDLGITVVATQLEAEFDSFNNQYDAGAATGAPEYVVGPTYDYFPQVMASATVVTGVDTVITATGKLNSTDATTTELAKVTVPPAAVASGATKLTVKVVPKEPEATTTSGTALVTEINDPNRETANFDIKVEGIASNNNADINVEVFVGKGLANVKIYHNGALIDSDYDPATGKVSFSTTSFSDFTAAYDAAVAAIGTKTYGSVANAFAAVKADETIILLKDADVLSTVQVTKSLTLNLNGYKLTAKTKGSRMLWVTAPNVNLTINATAAGSGMVIGDTHAASKPEKVWGFVDLRAGSEGSKVVVNGGSYTGSVCANDNNNYGSMFMNRSSSEIVLNNVVVETDVCVLNNASGGKVTVNDSKVNITGIDAYLTAAFYTGNAEAEFNNVDLTAKYGGCVQVANKATLNNCNIVVTDNRNGTGTHQNCAVAACYDGIVTINGGTYSAPYAVYVYNTGGTFDINGGSFKGSNAVLKADEGGAINVNGGSFDGAYSMKNATLSIKGGTFTSDPTDYLANGYEAKEIEGVYKVAEGTVIVVKDPGELETALKTMDNTGTIYLAKDFDLSKVNWTSPAMSFTSSGVTVTIDGRGHTIKNLTSTDNQYGGLIGKLNTNGAVIIKNLNLENVKLRGTNVDGECAGGALIGWMDRHGDSMSIENVHVTGVDIDGFKYTGGLIGYSNTDISTTITNCSVTGTDTAKTINSSYNESGNYKGHTGGLVGYFGKGPMSNCTLSNIDITRGGEAQSDRTGVLVGTLTSDASITSATVSNVTLLGVPVTSTSNMFGPGASAGSVSGITVK